MVSLSRQVASGKLAALSAGADIVRREILGKSSPSEQAQSGPFNPAGFRRSSGLSSSEAAPFSAAVKRVFCKTDCFHQPPLQSLLTIVVIVITQHAEIGTPHFAITYFSFSVHSVQKSR